MPTYISFRVLIKRLKAIRFMMMDKTVPKRKKLLVLAGIVYLFLPVDIIPPVLGPIGFIDDVFLWLWILFHLKGTLDTYWMGEKEVDYSKKYKDALVDENYEVEVESEKKAETEKTADNDSDKTSEEV